MNAVILIWGLAELNLAASNMSYGRNVCVVFDQLALSVAA